MEQRRLRLGDILDDYCPRERRLTNHAVVAMIEDDVKQTRCTTCDAEHVYKGGKVPRRRKAETPAALYKEVLAGMPDAEASPVLATGHADAGSATSPAADESVESRKSPQSSAPDHAPSAPIVSEPAAPAAPSVGAAQVAAPDVESPETSGNDVPDIEDGPVHRPLIRAQLPRIEGHKEERRLPEFTIRQAGRGGGFRGGDARMKQPRAGGQGGNGGNGNRPHGGGRFGGPRPGGPGRGQPGRGGPSAGFRGGAGQPRQGGPKKRSR
jgi:translation initiation factor IF-2